jgi:hypothetical protein
MGLLLQNMKSRILHNIMQSRPLPMNITKKVDPHKIQKLATNVVWNPQGLKDGKNQRNAQCDSKKI